MLQRPLALDEQPKKMKMMMVYDACPYVRAHRNCSLRLTRAIDWVGLWRVESFGSRMSAETKPLLADRDNTG